MNNLYPKFRLAAGTVLILATTMLAACGGPETKTTTQETASYQPAPAVSIDQSRPGLVGSASWSLTPVALPRPSL